MVQVAGQVVSQVRLTRKKAQVESWVLLLVKKKGSDQVFPSRVGSDQKILIRFAMSTSSIH